MLQLENVDTQISSEQRVISDGASCSEQEKKDHLDLSYVQKAPLLLRVLRAGVCEREAQREREKELTKERKNKREMSSHRNH